MAERSIPQFLETLGASQLLSDAQFELLTRQLQGNPLSAEGLAQVLVRQNHLTEWQANQLLKGQSGFVLNHYRLLNPIGRGGMGHVFRGLDVRCGNVVAVKVMARKLTGNQKLVSRFRREIRASSELNSPYVVRTLDAGRVGRVDFMVMEYVNGDQVDRIANRLGRVPARLACEMIRHVAEGLQHAHEHRMVHRDIKPSNLMVHWDESGNGTTKLMDMGLVLVLSDSGDDHTVTRAGQVMGTPDYMSPEQGWDTTQVDIRSDIYSLGCTLFRLLTAKIPFTGSNPLQVLSQRLQRDAPTARSVCEDIPHDVSAIVEKMTKRDPDARYQTPAEVAAALASVGEPLRKASFQEAARKTNNDPNATFSDPQSDEVDETDVTYQQFLTEVDKGTSVNLLLTTDDNIAPHMATLPMVDVTAEPRSTGAGKSRTSSLREQKTGYVVAGFAITVLVLAGAAFVMSGNNPAEIERPVVPVSPPTAAEGRFVEVEPATAQTGRTWTFAPKIETQGVTGKIVFDVSDIVPVGVEVEASTGALTWKIPPGQSTGVYTLPLLLFHEVSNQQRTKLAETSLKVNVEYGPASVMLPNTRPFELDAEKKFTATVGVDAAIAKSLKLKYRLAGSVPEELTLDETSGTISWRPKVEDMGRHTCSLEVFREGASKSLDQQELTLLVLPTNIRHVLAEIPLQKIKPGETFRFEFPPPDLARIPQIQGSRVIETAGEVPAGMELSPDSRELVWNVPPDATGTVTVPLQAKLVVGRSERVRRLEGTAVLQIEIAVPTVKSPSNKMPSEEQIVPALAELHETYKQRLAAARTLPQKNAMANQLLELSYAAEAGVADAALLVLIEEELAERSRAVDILFDVAAIRATRYGTNELTDASDIVKLYRRTSLDVVQQDVVVEHGLRLAKQATDAANFGLTDELLQMVTALLRGTATQGAAGQLSADVTSAAKLAGELAKDSSRAADSIKAMELSRLLGVWQFSALFGNTAELSHFGIRQAGAGAVNGRGYWTIKEGFLRLEGVSLQAAVGFFEPTQSRSRYVVRLNVLPGTTSAQLVIGATDSGNNDFAAFGVIVDATAPGRLVDIRNRSTTAEPTTPVRLLPDQANRVEVVVDGTAVVVRVNGAVVTQTQVAGLTAGRIGLAADLGNPEPRVLIRDARILPLPPVP